MRFQMSLMVNIAVLFVLAAASLVPTPSHASTPDWCNVKDQGAIGNGVADDGPAILACASLGNGTVYLPTGVYCAPNGVSDLTNKIQFIGDGPYASYLVACGNDVTVLTLNNSWSSISGLTIYGYGYGSFPFALPTQPAVHLGSAASNANVLRSYIAFGTFPIKAECRGCHITESVVTYGYGDGGLRSANAYIVNSGQYWLHTSLDQVLPVAGSSLAYGTTITPWAASTAYGAGAVVQISCLGRAFWIQATIAGTSGGSAPACQNYGVAIIDNSVTWMLVAPINHHAAQVDTGSNEVYFNGVDMTGMFSSAFTMTNTLAGAVPQQVQLVHSTPGGSYLHNIQLVAGTAFEMIGGDVSHCNFTGCTGAYAQAGFGDATFNGVRFFNDLGYSIVTGSGVQSLTLIGNKFQTGKIKAVSLGASNDYITGIGNNCNGATGGGLSGSPGTHGYFPAGTAGNPAC